MDFDNGIEILLKVVTSGDFTLLYFVFQVFSQLNLRSPLLRRHICSKIAAFQSLNILQKSFQSFFRTQFLQALSTGFALVTQGRRVAQEQTPQESWQSLRISYLDLLFASTGVFPAQLLHVKTTLTSRSSSRDQ